MSYSHTVVLPPGLASLFSNRARASRGFLAVAALVFACLGAPSARAHGDLEIRIGDITQRINSTTNNPARLYLERAELLREHRNWEDAAADYGRAGALDPKLPNLELCRARMLAESGQLEAARTILDGVISQSPMPGEALVARGQVLARLGQRAPAITDYLKGLELAGESEPNHFLELARLQVADGQVQEALRSLDWGLKRVGPELSLYSEALELELQLHQLQPALKRVDAILEHAKRKETWLARRGEILLEAGNPTEARSSLAAALLEIKKLPPRLQQTPSMDKLRVQINTALARIPEEARKPQ